MSLEFTMLKRGISQTITDKEVTQLCQGPGGYASVGSRGRLWSGGQLPDLK